VGFILILATFAISICFMIQWSYLFQKVHMRDSWFNMQLIH